MLNPDKGIFRRRGVGFLAWSLPMALAPFASIHAQQGPGQSASLEEVVVIARKKDERLQDIPVAVSVFSKSQIEALALQGFEDVAELTPGLSIKSAGGRESLISLRGITTGGLNTSSDQAISINIDGIQLSDATVLRSGQYDVEQIEILKGPQALFFGKNSPGGIIHLRTSDATDELFAQFRAGYEVEADERYGEMVVSGPLHETLGARLLLRSAKQDGAYDNVAPDALDTELPRFDEDFGRLTMNWRPGEQFQSRFKVAYGEIDGGPQGFEQRFGCGSSGLDEPVSGPLETCKFDRKLVKGTPDPRLSPLARTFRSQPEGDTSTLLSSLEWSYQLNDTLRLTGLTGYYDLDYFDYDNILPILDATALVGGIDQSSKSLSQELRLDSDFDGALNVMVGAFYDDRRYDADSALLVNGSALFENRQKVDSDSWSVFGQLTWDVTDTLEISGGARYTDEERSLSGTAPLTPGGVVIVPPGSYAAPDVLTGPLQPDPDEVSYTNLSPELALSWRPHDSYTFFASYREGFKSGGFNTSVVGGASLATVPGDQSYDEETVEGFEFGVKSEPLPGLRVNAAAFHFEIQDMQLSTFDFSGGGVATRVVNAGEAQTQGVEVDAMWLPGGLDGLVLSAAIAYNDTEYTDELFSPCNGLQIAGERGGCDFRATPDGVVPVAPGSGDTQNLRGEPLLRAPQWSGNVGAEYEFSPGRDWRVRLHGNASYSGSYQTNARYDPRAKQDDFWLLSAGFTVISPSEHWTIDLIGRNLTNEIYLTGSGVDVPQGGTVPGVSAGELQGSGSTPRAYLLQITYRPFGA